MRFRPSGTVAVDTFLALPRWLYVGVAVGLLTSVGVAAAFLVAARLFPDGNRTRGTRRSTEERRRVEIRRYLQAIGEGFVEDASVAGESVAFYLPTRDVAVTFDARTFLALERTPTYSILMEHEMPGVALGHRLPFETPDVFPDETEERAADRERERFAPGGESESAYATLGLPSGASDAAVRRAYRERVKEVHPDHGGDEAEFRRVREAYDTARQEAP
ncbi:J domain-containing protein [Natronomonas salina]|uniref:J domain-containing protein n=1 Tax=Natronomonas salina TaxID=1710540 RepID=UPI0015B745AC|nr:J domain-containing protein [Natronomonas salina]